MVSLKRQWHELGRDLQILFLVFSGSIVAATATYYVRALLL